MVLFALFAHERLPLALLSALGLLAAALAAGRGISRTPSVAGLLAFHRVTRRCALFAVMGLALGIGLGIAYRIGYGQALLPEALTPFALVSVAIGATEELFYRGYVQGRLRALGPGGAVACAALAHTAYKVALFVLPPSPLPINYAFLAIATFLGGLAFGALRELPKSLLPPILAHAAFDLLVYGGHAQAPWWVW